MTSKTTGTAWLSAKGALALSSIWVFAALSIISPVCSAESSSKTPKDRVQAERELSRIATVIGKLEREMRKSEVDRTKASRDLELHERSINRIAGDQQRLTETAAALNAQLKRLRSTHAALTKQVTNERLALAGELRVAYALGRGDRAQLLFQRKDPSAIARLLRYHSYFTRAQRERIVMLENSLARLRETETAIARETERLAGVNDDLRSKRRALEAKRRLRASALQALNDEIANNRVAVSKLRTDQKQLAKLIARLRDAINDVPAESAPPRSFKTLRGKLPWPVRGSLKRRFGSRRSEAEQAFQGVILKAPMGKQVRAIAHGRVVFADWLRGFGLMVIVDHGSGYMSLYGHNQSLKREPGEWIAAGDSLATVGDSGGKNGPGLYFEIRRDGRPQNPTKWCSRRAKFASSS